MRIVPELDIFYDGFDIVDNLVVKNKLTGLCCEDSFELASSILDISEKHEIPLILLLGQFVAWNDEETAYQIFNELKQIPRNLTVDFNDKSFASLYMHLLKKTSSEVADTIVQTTLRLYVKALYGIGCDSVIPDSWVNAYVNACEEIGKRIDENFARQRTIRVYDN